MTTIKSLYSDSRRLDRPIEKVIDYAATSDEKLGREVAEYEVTTNVEACFRRFLDTFGAGVGGSDVTEIGIWVAGFYGSGKSSFTKYLGFALDPDRKVGDQPFIDLLVERIKATEIGAELKTLARRQPTAVVMLDLGTEQLATNAAMPVSTVLYRKTMVWAGYSTISKIAEVERRLDAVGKLDALRAAYAAKFPGTWDEVHDDPMAGGAYLDALMPAFFPNEFPNPGDFRRHNFVESPTVEEQARRMIEIVRRKSGRQNILFLIDEAGQYVASRGDLILNLDGLARALKEQGHGRVWIAATAQQTLTEIVEKAAINSAELFKLKDRFPIGIELTARDIREITWRRLLTKSAGGEDSLKRWFGTHGPATVNNTRLTGIRPPPPDLDQDSFVRYYPFLPSHFDVLLALIRVLARRGVGLRSAIKVIQDILVDPHRQLPAGIKPIAERDFGSLACVDDFYDTLRADIERDLPHVVAGVERVRTAYPDDALALRVAKAIAALQPLDNFPRSAENIAALLYRGQGTPGLLPQVRETLQRLLADRTVGIVEVRDVDGGERRAGESEEDYNKRKAEGTGFLFLSDGVRPLQDKRSRHQPGSSEKSQVLIAELKKVFDPAPTTSLLNAKRITAQVRFDRTAVTDPADLALRIESVQPVRMAARREELLTETRIAGEWKDAIAWLVVLPDEVDQLLVEICRSEFIVREVGTASDRDVGQFSRGETRRASDGRDQLRAQLTDALMQGTILFRGSARAATERGLTVDAAARSALTDAAETVYDKFRLAAVSAPTDLAYKLLSTERIDRAGREIDPLKLITQQAGRAQITATHPALAEVLRELNERLDAAGSGRLQGNFLQELFAGAPWGWSKDVTRYLFAGLLWAGAIELFPPEAGGVVRIPGPKAAEALKSTLAFNRVGVGRRGDGPTLEAKERAATRLAELFGVDVLPTEARIGQVVRAHVPSVATRIAALPTKLRLLGLPGEARALKLSDDLTALLQDDAGAATSILGAAESTIAADTRWANAALTALETDGEALVTQATALRVELRKLAELFPEVGGPLDADPAGATIDDVLAAETFAERFGELRTALRTLRQSVSAAFTTHAAAFQADIAEARRRIQALPEWAELTEGDQADVDKLLTDAAEAGAARANVTSGTLTLLLTRAQGLSALEARAVALVHSRAADRRPKPPVVPPEPPVVPPEPPVVPPEPPVIPPPVDPPVVPPIGRTRRVSLRRYVTGAALTADQIDTFVDTLRDRLKSAAADGPVQLTLDEEDR